MVTFIKSCSSSSNKFYISVNLNFLFRVYADEPQSLHSQRALEMSLHTLRMMAKGGIHDHVAKVMLGCA